MTNAFLLYHCGTHIVESVQAGQQTAHLLHFTVHDLVLKLGAFAVLTKQGYNIWTSCKALSLATIAGALGAILHLFLGELAIIDSLILPFCMELCCMCHWEPCYRSYIYRPDVKFC